MRVIGIVAEWNPFHNGHAKLINHIRSHHQDALIVSVMSGAFCQRGEASIFDKWRRTEMALANGIDVVIELPQYAATASLEQFAAIGVQTLCEFYLLDALYCGSESGDSALITEQAHYLQIHQQTYNQFIQEQLQSGISYTQASQLFFKNAGFVGVDRTAPNDRLALHYRMALPDAIPLYCFKRTVAHDRNDIQTNVASASTIRQLLYQKDRRYQSLLTSATRQYITPEDMLPQHEHLLFPLKVFATSHSPQDLANICGIRDGWEHRLHSSILNASSYEALLTLAQTRHYSRSRIRRLLLSLLSPVPSPAAEVPYLRVLGATKKGRILLKKSPQKAPLILNVAKSLPSLSATAHHYLMSDIQRQNLADLLSSRPVINRDYLEKPRIL